MIDDLVRAASQSDWELARQLLYEHWQNHCPKLFGPNVDSPWEVLHDESAISSILFRPLAAAYIQDVDTRTTSLLPLNEEAGTKPEERRPGQICGYVFKNGEPTYSCRECATDPTCVLCHKCFQQSIHKDHKYRMSTSAGSGYCDCGDADAWLAGYACKLHELEEGNEGAMCSTVSLPQPLHDRVHGLTSILLQYSTMMICWTEEEAFPLMAKNPVDLIPPYQTMLFNDETHTYDAVIRALELAIHCSRKEAMLLATIVDREGRSTVKAGMKAECDRVKQEIQRRTQRDTNRRTEKTGPLLVKVLESAFVAHQAHVMQIISWLNQQTEHFPSLSYIIGDVLLNVQFVKMKTNEEEEKMEVDQAQETEANTIVDVLMKSDKRLWKAARTNFHQMLMKTVLMHMDLKYAFSKKFLELYGELYGEFVDDDHDHDVSIVSLTVQFFTVPTLARRLIAEENAMTRIFNHLKEHTNPYIAEPKEATSRFDFAQRTFPATLKRALHMVKDLIYLLNTIPKPEEWTPGLRDNFVHGCEAFFSYLHHMQGMDEVRRLSVEHQVWELEWETAFNIQLRQQEAVTMIIAWANSDKEVHHRVLGALLDACILHKPTVTDPGEPGETKTIVEVNGDTVVVSAFDVLKGAVSIHQPLYRMLAGLFSVDKSFVRFLERAVEPSDDKELILRKKVKDMGMDIYEMALRVSVLVAQAGANLWRRNGFSLVNQIHNYLSPLCRTEMYDKDLLLLQVGVALTDPTEFLLHYFHRYRVAQWADAEYDGTNKGVPFGPKVEQEESSKFIVALAEEMLHMLIVICGERYIPGVGQCTRLDQLNREVLHILCVGPQAFSAISKRISEDARLEKLSLDTAVKTVGEFRKPTPSSAGTFCLRDSMRDQYNPFFYHYSRSDLSQAELYQEKSRAKCDRSIIACPPPKPIPFSPFFAPIRHLLRCPALIRVHRIVLDRVSKRNRYGSDRLFHRVLYLIGMALNEQAAAPTEYDFVGEANKERLLSFLEALTGKSESQSHADLLWWTIQKYKELERLSTSGGVQHEEKAKEVVEEGETNGEEMKKKRAARAAQMRAQALQKMQRMQRNFVDNMKKDEQKEGGAEGAETVEKEATPTVHRLDEDEDAAVKLSDSGFPVCLGHHKVTAETVLPRSVKCILCQEEELLDANAKPFVCAAFVQKSHLFTQSVQSAPIRLDVHLVNAALPIGVDASTCSHTMHAECYQNLSESLLNRERNRPRQQMVFNQKMVDSENGEYLCPLCKRLSNTAMPLVPALHLLPISGFSTNRPAVNEEFDEWVDRVKNLVNSPPQDHRPFVKSHSRKRSHSERALNDLVKQEEKDKIASGSLENALSSSVPSASAMDLLMEGADGVGAPVGSGVQRTLSTTNAVGERQREQMALAETEARNAADFLNDLLAMGGERAQTASPVSSPSSDDTSRRNTASSSSGKRSDSAGRFFAGIPNNVLQMIMKMPHAVISKFTKKVVPVEKYEDMVRAFTKFVIKVRSTDGATKELEDQVRGVMSAMAVWQSTAFVVRSVATVLRVEGKPLFGALNTRQRDCILAMSRLSVLLSYNLQPFGEVICQMLKVFLSPPPESFLTGRSPSEVLSSPTPTSPPPTSEHAPTTNKLLTSPIAQFFLPSTPHSRKEVPKEANVNILHVDMLSLALELMMSIGWTWHDGHQLLRGVKHSHLRDLVPDGSLDELHVLRLALAGLYFQVFASFVDDCDEHEKVDEEESVCEMERVRVQTLWRAARERDGELVNVKGLIKKLVTATLDLLRPMALFYQSITLIPPPEALKDPFVDEFEPLCRYMGLPSQLADLLDGAATVRLFEMWSVAVPHELLRGDYVVQPLSPNLLIDLPEDFSDLINRAAKFRCPLVHSDEKTATVPTMCLVCGTVLCSQSYCCQRTLGKDTVGACQYHMHHCTGQSGIFLRLRDSQLAFLTSRGRGCFKPAPYVDEFGETDIGFRRGNPLHLNREQYAKVRQLWLHQGIAEEVVNQFEMDHRNMAYEWNHF